MDEDGKILIQGTAIEITGTDSIDVIGEVVHIN